MSTPTAAERTSTLGHALRAASKRLAAADVDSPRLAAEALLSHTLDLSRAHLLAHLEQPLSLSHFADYQTLVDRCESGEPLAYVLGHREFYGLDFVVDSRVLIPRPETELLIETAIAIAHARSGTLDREYRIADIGTGSGAIAVTLAAHLPQASIIAIDISPEAIEVACENARRHAVADRIEFKVGDLLTPIDAPVDVVAANLPYVRNAEWAYLSRSIRHYEPEVAFNGGSDGLGLVSQLLDAAPHALRPGGSILMEIGASHGDAAIELARDAFPAADIQVKTDVAGLDRLLVVRTMGTQRAQRF